MPLPAFQSCGGRARRPGEVTASGGRVRRDSRSRCRPFFLLVPEVDLPSAIFPCKEEHRWVLCFRCQNVLGQSCAVGREGLSLK